MQDLVVASRRLAAHYRFRTIQPSHLLHALTANDTGRNVLSMSGLDVTLLRAATIREFRAHSEAVRDPGTDITPSEIFDICCRAYLGIEEGQGYEGGLNAIVATIREYREEDPIVNAALEEADMTRGIPASMTAGSPPLPEEDEIFPDLDEFLEQRGGFPSDTEMRGPSPEDESDPEAAAGRLRKSFRERQREMTSRRAPEGGGERSSKEAEETRAAVRAAQRDLTRLALGGELDPVVGRDAEIDRVIEILLRRRKPNVILVAEPGVGKSALVEGLARRLVEIRGPLEDLGARPLREVSITAMVAGSRYRGDFEGRMTALVAEAERERAILFIDEIHMLMGSGAAQRGGMDGANILKPALARDDLSLIGATTPEEAMSLREDKALMRRFELVHLDEPDREGMRIILDGAATSFLSRHGVTISAEMTGRLLDYGERYLAHRRNPDRSFDILDLAGVSARRAGRREIGEDDFRHAVRRLGGDLPGLRAGGESPRSDGLRAALRAEVAGQDKALQWLAAEAAARLGRNGAARVIRVRGAAGLGKTHACRTLAASLGKRLVQLGFDSLQQGAFEALWNRLVMTLEADRNAVIAVHGAGAAQKLDNALAGETAQGRLALPVIGTPLILCVEDGEADAVPIGFGGARPENAPEVAFTAPREEALAALVEKVAADLETLCMDAGVPTPDMDRLTLHLAEIAGDRPSYAELRVAGQEWISNP